MAWIESHQSLLTHRKTGRLARALGITKVTAIGHLHAFWWWCLENAQDGILDRCDAEDIADGACWEGDPAVFVAALVSAGFVDELEGHRLVHEWMDYAGKLIDQRRANAERQRNWRDRHARPAADDARTSRNADVTVTSPQRHGATVPNPTQQDRTPPLHDDSHEGDTPDIRPAAAGADVGDDRLVLPPPPSSTSKPPKLRTLYGEDSEPMQLARSFAEGLRRNKPDVRLPRDLQPWAREFDLMARVDHRPREKIEAVMAYALGSTFWRRVVLSAGKLREKFDTLDIQREEDANGRNGRHRTGSAANRAGPGGRTRYEVGTPEYYEDAERRMAQAAAANQW